MAKPAEVSYKPLAEFLSAEEPLPPLLLTVSLSVFGFVACKHCFLTVTRLNTRLDAAPIQSRRFYLYGFTNAMPLRASAPLTVLSALISLLPTFSNAISDGPS